MSDATADDPQGDPGEDISVVTLAGVERLISQSDSVEWTATGEHTPALGRGEQCV